jgi:hypothetical protein
MGLITGLREDTKMKKRFIACGIFSVFLMVLFTGNALAATESLLVQSTKDNQWNYSQVIIITENANKTLTGYPVLVCLNSSNFDFSEAKEDGSDIRFFSKNEMLNYWVENWNLEKKEAVIWVKVPYISAKKTTEILMKYGNSRAKSASDGKSTFDFFDNFEQNTLNDLDWSSKRTGDGTIEIENGICEVSIPKSNAYDSSTIYSKKNFGINSMFVVKRKKVTTGTDSEGPLLRQGFTDQIESRKNEIRHETEYANENRVGWETVYKNQKYNQYDLTDVSVPEDTWYVSGIAWFMENNTRKIAWFENGMQDSKMDYASNDFIADSPMRVYLYAAVNQDSSKSAGYMAVDYVLVRKFVGNEPTVRIASTENKPENSTTNISGSASGSISENTSQNTSEPKNVSRLENVSKGVSQVQENLSKNTTVTRDRTYPEYKVGISGIKLSSPYRFDFPSLVKELDSSGINTIFLTVDTKDIWQYERFVKMAHKDGIFVHAVLLEDFNCSDKGTLNTCQDSLNILFDYNKKSLAPFDGINIFINSDKEGSQDITNYTALFETAHQKAGKNVSISASIPHDYSSSKIEKIAPLVDFFIVRAYCLDVNELNSAPVIVDAVAPEMGEIRGAGSKGLIEISVDKGFQDKTSIQELFAALADYYSSDPAFLGVSTNNYGTYACLPVKADPNKKESLIPELPKLPGFSALSVLIASLGVFALLRMKRK